MLTADYRIAHPGTYSGSPYMYPDIVTDTGNPDDHYPSTTALPGTDPRTNDTAGVKVEAILPDGGVRVRLINLLPYTRYLVTLNAFNSQGHGPYSTPQEAITMEDSELHSIINIHRRIK